MQAEFISRNPAVKDSYFKVALANKGNGANVSSQTENKLAARKLCTLFQLTPTMCSLVDYHDKQIHLSTSPSYLILYRSVCLSFKQ